MEGPALVFLLLSAIFASLCAMLLSFGLPLLENADERDERDEFYTTAANFTVTDSSFSTCSYLCGDYDCTGFDPIYTFTLTQTLSDNLESSGDTSYILEGCEYFENYEVEIQSECKGYFDYLSSDFYNETTLLWRRDNNCDRWRSKRLSETKWDRKTEKIRDEAIALIVPGCVLGFASIVAAFASYVKHNEIDLKKHMRECCNKKEMKAEEPKEEPKEWEWAEKDPS